MEQQEQDASFVDQLLDWLPNASPQDLLTYVESLREQDRQLVLGQKGVLLSELQRRKIKILTAAGAKQAARALDPGSLLIFMRELASCKDNDDAAALQAMYANISLNELKLTQQSQIIDWLATYNALFYLFSSEEYLRRVRYLHTIVSLRQDTEALHLWCQKIAEAWVKANQHFRSVNFYEFPLSPQDKGFIEAAMKELAVLPPIVVEGALEGDFTYVSFDLLTDLYEVTQFILCLFEGGQNIYALSDLDNSFWDYLSEGLRIEDLAREMPGKLSPNDLKPLFQSLDQIFSVTNIGSGLSQNSLVSYYNALPVPQKAEFKKQLKLYLSTSPLIETLLDGIDLDYFTDQINGVAKEDDRSQYINSLESEVPAEYWDLTKKLLETLAVIFM